jgi:hypothetical protein
MWLECLLCWVVTLQANPRAGSPCGAQWRWPAPSTMGFLWSLFKFPSGGDWCGLRAAPQTVTSRCHCQGSITQRPSAVPPQLSSLNPFPDSNMMV